MAKKKVRTRSPIWVAVAAVVAVLAGTVLGAASLALHFVPEVSAKSDPAPPGTVYYIKGDTSESPGWQARAAALTANRRGNYAFIEGDLNAWARINLRPTPAPREGQKLPHVIVVDYPNFRITEDARLQMTVKIEAPALLPGRAITYQSRGEVRNGRFEPSEGWIGASPVPLFNKMVFAAITGTMAPSDAARSLSANLAQCDTQISGNQLLIVNR